MDHLNDYKIITLTHKTAALKDLGQLVWTGEGLADRLAYLKAMMAWSELMYLATCNRVMFFFVSPERCSEEGYIHDFFAKAYPELEDAELLERLYASVRVYEGREAINHLFEVGSSIDSLVVGEREILRQLREAYEQNRAWKLSGDAIRLAMRFAVEASKKVYTQTRIGEKPVSVVSLAVQELMRRQPRKNARVLIVGAGQTNTLVVKLLLKKGFKDFRIFNRSLANAELLAQSCGGKAYTLADLPNYREGFDVLVACTAATEPVIQPELYAQLLQGDENPKILLDLSIPNNIDKSLETLYPQSVYIEIEDLNLLAQANLAFRQQEVEAARTLLEEEVSNFRLAHKARQIELTLREVPEQIRAVKEHALNRLFREEVEQLDEPARALLEKVMGYMEKRCIAIPLQVAREQLSKNEAL